MHACIETWADALPLPAVMKRALRRAATRAITPDVVTELLERAVWPRFAGR